MGNKNSIPKFNNCKDAINLVENNNDHGPNYWDNICEICECRNYLLNNKSSDSNITYWKNHCKNDRNSDPTKCVTYNTLKSNPNANVNNLQKVSSFFWNANFTLGSDNIEPFIEGNIGPAMYTHSQADAANQSKLFAKNAGHYANTYALYANRARRNAQKAKRKTENILSETEDVLSETERHGTAAEKEKLKAESQATAAENAKSEAERHSTAAENAKSETERQVTVAKNAKLKAVIAQEGAQAAKEESESILDDVEHDIGNGIIQSNILNPSLQNSINNSDRRNLEKIKSKAKNNIQSFMNFFNSNISEGFDVMDFFNAYVNNEEQRIAMEEKDLQHQVNDVKKDQGLEFGALRNDIMGNILMDYMINEGDGSNVEKVYSKLNQENNYSLRKIQISNYYTKSYKAYIHLLKIILLAIAIIIPILIFNRLEIISKDITLFVVSIIILVTSIYCIYKIYLLYMKDPIDFDKIKIPEDGWKRSSSSIGSKRNYKDSPFKSFGVTCIGDECCDASMVYDNLRNKCIMKTQETQENFHNYFENAMIVNNSKNKIIKQNDCPELEKTFYYLGGNANVIEGFSTSTREMLTNSLKNSNNNDF
jgi:hypothetical protein